MEKKDSFFKKLAGDKQALPKPYPTKQILLGSLAACIGLTILLWMHHTLSDYAFLLGSLGATCVLIFGFPDLPFSQPRNVIFAHFLTAAIGFLFYNYITNHYLGLVVAIVLCILCMMSLRIVHPPAGSNPIIIYTAKITAAKFLLFPVISGPVLLIIIALIFHNLSRKERYPKYW